MIVDAFCFFNELELLEIRLHELWDVVDRFVIVEATRTHTGQLKPMFFDKHSLLFDKFMDKIIYIIVDDMPMTEEEIQASITPQDRVWLDTGYQLGDNWVRERFQRNAIMRGLTDCDPEDIIIIGDADEIVRKSIVENLEETMCDGSNAVEQTLNTYYINFQCTNMPWWGSKILRRKFVTNPSEHRFHTPAACFIRDGGWHFGFLGGADAIKEKIKAYAHQEFNDADVLDNIEERLLLKKDALGRLYEYEVVPLDGRFPQYVLDNLDKFGHLIYND